MIQNFKSSSTVTAEPRLLSLLESSSRTLKFCTSNCSLLHWIKLLNQFVLYF